MKKCKYAKNFYSSSYFSRIKWKQFRVYKVKVLNALQWVVDLLANGTTSTVSRCRIGHRGQSGVLPWCTVTECRSLMTHDHFTTSGQTSLIINTVS